MVTSLNKNRFVFEANWYGHGIFWVPFSQTQTHISWLAIRSQQNGELGDIIEAEISKRSDQIETATASEVCESHVKDAARMEWRLVVTTVSSKSHWDNRTGFWRRMPNQFGCLLVLGLWLYSSSVICTDKWENSDLLFSDKKLENGHDTTWGAFILHF